MEFPDVKKKEKKEIPEKAIEFEDVQKPILVNR